MPRRRSPEPLLVTLQGRVGYLRGCKVCGFIVAWGIVTESLGRPPESIEEYADWWKQSHRTAYREQALFRLAVHEYETPTELWEEVRKQVDVRRAARERDKIAARLATLSISL